MVSCCSYFMGENDITVEKKDVDPSMMVPRKRELTVDELKLKKVFSRLIGHVWDKELIKDHKILVLANKHGEILKCVTSDELPDFFLKKEEEIFDWSIEEIGPNAIGLTAKTCKSSTVSMSEHFFEPFHTLQTNAVPVCNGNNEMIAILGFIDQSEVSGKAIGCLQGLIVAFELALIEEERVDSLERDGQKRETLFNLTRTLYSTIDVNEVLSMAITSFKVIYPNAYMELWITQEYLVPNLPIKQMTFIPNRNDINGQAFLEGKLIAKRREGKTIQEIAVPLRGKQGVYGVIHMSGKALDTYTEEELNFISNVTEIIGNAFENAKLYQQSNNLVRELRLINELTKKLNQSLHIDEILQYVLNELIRQFKATNVCVLKVNDRKDSLTVIASNVPENINDIISINEGYMGLVALGKEPIIVADIDTDKRLYDPYAEMLGYRSLMAVPITSSDEIIGVLSVSATEIQRFSYEDFKFLQVFGQHLGLAMTNAFLHEKVRQLAITDYLTDLYNRQYLDQEIQRSLEYDQIGSILLMDVDDFKKVNDTYGHHIGDQILTQVASILKTSIRTTDIAARWGGEEVAVYLPDVDTTIANQVGKRIIKRISSETNPKVTVSCGIATWDKEERTADILQLIRWADQALYEAKNNGKNQVRISSYKKT